MSTQPSILVVDDEPGMRSYLQTLLEVDGYRVETASGGLDALRRVQQAPTPDLVLLDVLMPDLDGLQTLEKIQQVRHGMKVVMLSCVSDTGKVVQAIRLGAHDYLAKPFHKADLDSVVQKTLAPPVAIAADGDLPGSVEEVDDDLFFLAASPSMRSIRTQIGLLANVDVPVLLLGESGTGKEVVARLIHKTSKRAHRAFLKVNCAALPGDLLESELFGYEAGAFTGANKPKPGKFEICDKGTILFDEIGEMPPILQAKLLHVLQDGQFSRLGSRSMQKVDVRVLAATNIDVQEAIAGKRFREDLYYRLNAFTIQVPPLRERREEIPLLLKHFMHRLSESYACPPLPWSPALLDACQRHPWPGNLRELGNFVKRYLVLRDEKLALKELREAADSTGATTPAVPATENRGGLKHIVRSVKDETEIQAITQALEQTNWNRKSAAIVLNISYKALLYKIRQYGIQPPAPSPSRIGRIHIG